MNSKTKDPTRINFTKAALDALPLPEAGKRDTYHDERQPGLQVRVTSAGAMTYSVFARVAGGAPQRITIGKHPAITPEIARRKAKEIISQLAQGLSPSAEKRAARVKGITLAEALSDYVAKHVRKGDGLALKPRTVSDYLKMVRPGKVKADGSRYADGLLFKLADKPIRSITAGDILTVHSANLKRGRRSCAYSMQVLRLVLKAHGIVVARSPFDPATPDMERVHIPQARAGDPKATENFLGHIGVWLRAANALPESVGVDYLKFCLLTGCRPSEPLTVLVSDCDLAGGRVTLENTKNRSDFTLALSRQAQEIVERQAKGKAPTDRLFDLSNWDIKKATATLVEASGVAFTAKVLRKVFASVADELVSASTLKRLLNHTQASDVADTHYIKKVEAQLRAGWQAVADHIEASAADNVVPLFKLN